MALETGSHETEQEASPAEIDWEADTNPYKSRFDTYRREADQRATRLSQYEQNLEALRGDDPAAQRAAAAALGIDLVEEEPTVVDPYDSVMSEVAQLKAQLAEREQRDAVREQAITVESRLDAMSLDESDKDWVLARAVALPAGEDGLPDLKAAYDELTARDTARNEALMAEWAKSKRAPNSIRPGTPATEQKNILEMTDEERIEAMLAKHGID